MLVSVAMLWLSAPAVAQVEAVRFASAQQASLYRELIGELRCLVCANQSLSDSNADLAKDLRVKVRDMVADGQSRAMIVDYMVARYGTYILYRPRFSVANFFLWVAPLAVVVAGLVVVIVMATNKSRPGDPSKPGKPGNSGKPYSAGQLRKARALLQDEGD